MENVECPRCGEHTITLGDRFKAGKWKDIYCRNCGGRLAANPIFMGLMYAAVCWNYFFFGFMTYHEKSWIYFGIMVFIGLCLEYFLLYMPLARLRPKNQNNINNG